MAPEDTQGIASGSTAHAFRNRLFWELGDQIPRSIPSGFLTVLYAMASAADPSGAVRFNKGRPITLRQIARGSRVDLKDARRYVNAAIAAGLVCTVGDRRPGKAVQYALLLSPRVDWGAAESFLKSTKRVRAKAAPPPWEVDNQGGPTPLVDEPNLGGPTPLVQPDADSAPRGTYPPTTQGDLPPYTWGDLPPTIPGSSMSLSMTGAERVPQPQVVASEPEAKIIQLRDESGWNPDTIRCAVCHRPMVQRHGYTTHPSCLLPEQARMPRKESS